ncbi:MAG: Acetyltransferase, GNAT family [Candidatus Tokpelaia hoelldobleri]|uniref:Acetyltransferase, GNAT family n=1 Tax=Candidatus Tokpelaia hoelldobleri TaxID=1902579 RepID=A0A1U9JT19_9HYPH|nr:MAG: Acetyltransferase, GNAT family [Candidatus Tokpelaia hoelldoblerii]
MPVLIREEMTVDCAAIRDLTKAAFASVEHSSQTEAEIIEALRIAGALTLSLVAIEDGDVIGHIAFSPVLVDGTNVGWYGLGPVSVQVNRQKNGIGSELVREGLQRLAQTGAKGCVVLGEPDYYKRFGFEADTGLVLDGVPASYFMRLVLHGRPPKGRVTYHAGFDAR